MLIRAKAPLRLGLAGGGTDIASYYNRYGGYVLNVTVDMYAYCTIEPTDISMVEFVAADLNKKEEYPSEGKLPVSSVLPLHTGVYNRVVADFCHKPLSFKMTTYSDAPPGSGLDSGDGMRDARAGMNAGCILILLLDENLPEDMKDIKTFANLSRFAKWLVQQHGEVS